VLLTVTINEGLKEPLKAVVAVQSGGIVSAMTILSNDRTLRLLSDLGFRMKVTVPEVANPELVTEVAYLVPQEDSPSLDVTSILSVFKTAGFSMKADKAEGLSKLLAAKYKLELSVEELLELQQAYKEFLEYSKGTFVIPIKVSSLFFTDAGRTLTSIKRYNDRQGPQFEYLTKELNVTNKMQKEEDIFFIEIPSLEKIRSNDISLNALLPDIKEVFKPFSHPIYGSTYALRYMESNGVQRQSILDQFKKRYGKYEEPIPKMTFEHVMGDTDNNELPIQPNELAYYNALIEFIKYDIAQLGREEPVEELFNKNVCSKDLQEYLQQTVMRIAAYNFMPTRNFPIYSNNETEEEYESRLEKDSVDFSSLEDKHIYDQDSINNIVSGPVFLEYFLTSAANKVGLRAYVEAIIKLSRWGDRKPTALVIEGEDTYLDMISMSTRSLLGAKEEMVPIDVDGFSLDFGGALAFENKIKDKELLTAMGLKSPWIDIPIGLEGVRVYSGGIKQKYYITLPELVMLYTSSPDTKVMRGIELKNGSFVVDSSVVPDDLESMMVNYTDYYPKLQDSSDSFSVGHTSRELKALCMEYQCVPFSGLEVMATSLMSEDAMSTRLQEMSFSSKEEFVRLIQERHLVPSMVLRINVAGVLVGAMLKTLRICNEKGIASLTGILNTCLEVLKESGITSESSFLESQRESQPVAPKVESTIPVVSEIKESSSFNETKELTLEEEIMQLEKLLFKPMPEGVDVSLILDSKGTVVAGFHQRQENGVQKTYICGPSYLATLPQERLSKSTNTFSGIEYFIYDALFKTFSGHPEKVHVAFSDVQTLQDFKKTLGVAFNEKRGI
jgi:hypothetical protein